MMAVDFTAYRHPVRAVRCPACGAAVGTMCRRPSGHRASDFHSGRKEAADDLFIAMHGPHAWIERLTDSSWKIHATGYRRAYVDDGQTAFDLGERE